MSAGTVRTYKDLLVWKKVMALSVEVYRLTETFPTHERHGLAAEARKRSRSVPCNIAEGHKHGSTAEYIRLLGIAAGSLAELETQLSLACRLGYPDASHRETVFAMHAEAGRMLDALIRALKAKIAAHR